MSNSAFQYFKFVCLGGGFLLMAIEAWKIEQKCRELSLPVWASVAVAVAVFVVITIFVRSEVVGFLLPAYVRSDRAYSFLTQSRKSKRPTKKLTRKPIKKR